MTESDLDRKTRALRGLLEVLVRLRAPDGCPWDRAQTVASLAPFLLEEAYEAVDAIGADRPDSARAAAVREELGDCLMNVLLIALAGETEKTFSVEEVADGIAAKLVRRHPHVFGETKVAGVAEVWTNWEKIKAEEKRAKNEDASAIAGVPVSLPACLRALRVVEKASRAGFRYTDLAGPTAKVEEEWKELRREIDQGDATRIEEEMGDLLFAAVVLASHVQTNPEIALRKAIERFSSRFRGVEARLGEKLRDASLSELTDAWAASKGGARENFA